MKSDLMCAIEVKTMCHVRILNKVRIPQTDRTPASGSQKFLARARGSQKFGIAGVPLGREVTA